MLRRNNSQNIGQMPLRWQAPAFCAALAKKFGLKNSMALLLWRETILLFCLAALVFTTGCDKKQASSPVPLNPSVEKPTLTIYQAAIQGDLQQLQLIFAMGVQVDALDQQGCTALYYAAMHGQVEAARFLIEHGADINLKQQDGMSYTAAHIAAANNQPAIIQLLHDKGADLNVGDYKGDTPLHVAAFNWRNDAVKTLLASDVEVLKKNKDGQTAWDDAWFHDLADHTNGGAASLIANKVGPMRCFFNTIPPGTSVRIGMQLNNNSPSGFINNNSGRIVGKTPCTVVLQESDIERVHGGIQVLFETTLADPYMSIATTIPLANIPPIGHVLEPGELYKLSYSLKKR